MILPLHVSFAIRIMNHAIAYSSPALVQKQFERMFSGKLAYQGKHGIGKLNSMLASNKAKGKYWMPLSTNYYGRDTFTISKTKKPFDILGGIFWNLEYSRANCFLNKVESCFPTKVSI